MDEKLAELRSRINEVDDQILHLLNRRAEISLEVGEVKRDADSSVFKPFREREVLGRLVVVNNGPMPEKHLVAIYREILSSSRKLQRPERLVYLGPEGTFSYFAAIGFLGHSADMIPKPNIEDIFQAVAADQAELGIVPLENSLQGTVGQTVDLFLRYDVSIRAEVFCPISISLMSRCKSLADVKVVYSHSKALEQCNQWLRANLPNAEIVAADSTAAAARIVAETGTGGEAAVGHPRLSDMFHLNVLAERIEDLPDNWTRFLVIGKESSLEGNRDKTSIVFTTSDKPGSLVKVLSLMARQGINLTKLESRPLAGEKWKYVFFADLECDLGLDEYKELLDEVKSICQFFKVLGCYPVGPNLDNGSYVPTMQGE